MTIKKQIVALGGGGFSMEPDNLVLDRYILSLTGKERPRVLFVPTASGDSCEYTVRFHEAFQSLHCRTSHLSLFRPPPTDMRRLVMDQDVIYVGGWQANCRL